MFKPILRINHFIAFLALLILVSSSCTSTKNIPYFKDVPDTIRNSTYNKKIMNYYEPTINKHDILLISIETIDPQYNTILNQSNTVALPTGTPINLSNPSSNGILVDNDGMIELTMVGRLKVDGLTIKQAKEAIRNKALIYYKDPVINVRISNFTITILGEVARPGTYNVNTEKITVLEALGLAGDLTIFGKRENIMLIREEDGVRKITRFDLKSSNFFSSPFYYLRQGDLIYIEPNKAKVAYNDQAQIRNITIGSSILTALALIISRFNFN